jgi:hypothetical protein
VEHALRQAQLAIILEKINALHTANGLYWNQKELSHEENVRHLWRQERLEQFRKEIQEQ